MRDPLPDPRHRPLVVGLGTSYCGDDAAGLLAARRLGGIELEGDPSALIELLDGADAAVLIDAVRSGSPPGTVHRFDAGAGPLPASVRGAASTHHVGLADAIELARAVGRLPGRTTVYGIEGTSFDVGAPLSASVAAAIDEVVVLARAHA